LNARPPGPPGPPARRRRLVAVAAALLAAGCGGTVMPDRDRPVPVATASNADADAARQYLVTLAELLDATPARQAELLDTARSNAENAPTTMHRLRYALMLATPGHGGSDPVAARRQLSELLARPELLLPAERSLAALALRDVDDRLVLIAENRRLLQEAAARDKDRTTTVNRRLQAELEENARLRRALDEAQKKLDAVTQLERSIVERGGAQGKP
jgi:hypothetical protein